MCSLRMSQIGRMNLGKDASTFKYYTMCGLQEGFEPFAVNMNREVTMWFSKRLPTFFNVPEDHPDIEVHTFSISLVFLLPFKFAARVEICFFFYHPRELFIINTRAGVNGHIDIIDPSLWVSLTPQVTRIDGTVDSPPCLKVTHKTYGTQNSNNDMVYCRLSMPVEFYSADKLLDESLKLGSDISIYT